MQFENPIDDTCDEPKKRAFVGKPPRNSEFVRVGSDYFNPDLISYIRESPDDGTCHVRLCCGRERRVEVRAEDLALMFNNARGLAH